MQALIEKASGLALYLWDDSATVDLREDGLFAPIRVADVFSGTHEVVAVPEPTSWLGRALRWSGVWEVVDQDALNARAAEIAAAEAQRLDGMKRKKISDTKTIRDRIELEASFAWACPVDGVTYTLDGDERSIARMLKVRDLLAEMEMQGTPPADAKQPWRTADDTYTPPLGTDDIQNMVYTKGLQGAAAWEVFRQHEQAIMALTTVDDVVAYDTSTGWPD